MHSKEFLKILSVILTILFTSIFIGDFIMTPIIIYHDTLVEFFGWLFLILIILLISGKFFANYIHIRSTTSGESHTLLIFKHTFKETLKQLIHRFLRFAGALSFLFFLGVITLFTIWINSKLIGFKMN